ncbi:MAG: GNAT family N-acetyltransferase [Treponema porcinum]|nr:GNAT family N-acetyltransferase [Treponema porcinum]MDY4468216.1 GNAT family N-acetyltransferase [Treponema porcinum]
MPELSLVLELDKKIIGHVMYSRSHIDADDGTQIPVMTFGPISIHPDFKRKGFGKILLDCSMEKARQLGGKCLLICGNIGFYGKSGFVPAVTFGIRYADDPESGAPYFLCKELEQGFLNGISGSYKDPEGYFVSQKNPAVFEEYEKQFPQKEKLRLPGQIF